MVLGINLAVFWDMIPCSLIDLSANVPPKPLYVLPCMTSHSGVRIISIVAVSYCPQ